MDFSNKSSFSFNRKLFTLGLNQFFKISDGMVSDFILGAGVNYSFPGKLKLTENDVSLGTVQYDSNVGFHFDLGIKLEISENSSLYTGLRYRNLDLSAKSYSDGNPSSLPNYLKTANASGIELSVTFARVIGKSE